MGAQSSPILLGTMKTNENSRTVLTSLPEELRLVSAEAVRTGWSIPETTLWRADRAGILKRLRIGKRAFYLLIDLKNFLAAPERLQAIAVPWTPAETAERRKAATQGSPDQI